MIMINEKTERHYQDKKVDAVPYREHHEIARVLLMGNSEVIIYRDEPGHLFFELFNPVPRISGN